MADQTQDDPEPEPNNINASLYIKFGNQHYVDLPYLNIDVNVNNANNTIDLKDLFDYQKLTIPTGAGAASAGAEEYYILNIKKQFICVKIQIMSDEAEAARKDAEEARKNVEASESQPTDALLLAAQEAEARAESYTLSRTYVKKPTINNDLNNLLPLIHLGFKSIDSKIVFNSDGEPEGNSEGGNISNEEALKIFNGLYQEIKAGHTPFFATPYISQESKPATAKVSSGGKKGGGTRKKRRK